MATRPANFRIDALRRLRAAIIGRQSEMVEALRLDLGKTEGESILAEISMVVAEIDLHIARLRRWMRPQRVGVPIHLLPAASRIVHQPYGVVLIIAPWNYPFQLMMMPLVGAISAGDCAVIKPSVDAPHTAQAVAAMLAEIFPEEYVAVAKGPKEETLELLDEVFDYIFFTGSPSFGRVVMAAAAKNLTPVTLELGGKSPCIVDKNADINIAAKRIAWGKLMNAGQTCVAPDYLMIHRSLKEKFVELYKYWVTKFYGDKLSESTVYPRIINDRSVERLVSMLSGGRVLWGGEADAAKRYVAPTLMDNVDPESALMTDEIFGPILPIVEFDEVDEAIAYVNSRPRPLALYYFGDRKVAKYVVSRSNSGGVCINDVVMQLANPNLPFGGVGNSGMGGYHGKFSFDAFGYKRAVMVAKTCMDLDFRYPPYKMLTWVKRLMMRG